MVLTKAKIDAQRILMDSRKAAVTVSLCAAASKLLFVFALGVSLYSLKILPSFSRIWEKLYLKIGFCALFLLAGLFSLLLYALTDFSEKQWFYKNNRTAQPVSAFFRPPRMRYILKIGFLFWLRQIFRIGLFLLYLAPFLLGGGGLYYALRISDVPIRLLYLSLGTLGCMLPLCLYFGFAAVQQFAFCDGLLAENPACGTVEILRLSRTLAKETAFALTNFKLRFVLWQTVCLLILPIFYVLPYYRQSVAGAVQTVIDKNHLSAQQEKPIVFFLPMRATAS